MSQPGQHLHLLAGEDGAGGVAGVGYHDSAGVLVYQGFDLLAVGVVIALLGGGGDGAGLAACKRDKGGVVGVVRLGDDYLVAVVKDGAHGHPERLAAAVGGQDVGGRQIRMADAVIVVAHRLQVLGDAVAGRVLEHGGGEAAHRVKELRGSFNVRLTYVQREDPHAPGARGVGVGGILAHGRKLAPLNFGRKLHAVSLLYPHG